MANVSDCAELQDEFWESPEIDELFSQVLLPDDVVGMPELADSLLPTHSAIESAVYYAGPQLEDSGPARTPRSRFGRPVTESQITATQKASVPFNTKKNTNWGVNVWKDWSKYREQTCSAPEEHPPHILTCQVSELNNWLCRFVLEVRRKDGKPYPPNTLHQLCCAILRYVRGVNPDVDFFQNPEFAPFRKTLDAEMKRLKHDPGIATVARKAEPISDREEEILWSKGVLGSHSPQTLVDTMVFMAGMYFALRSGEEHRQLRFSSVTLVEKAGSTPHLLYIESVSKNNPGGLKHRKLDAKQVVHHGNREDPSRCFVEMYRQYCSHRPAKVKEDAFYLCPIRNAKGQVWYKDQPIGVNTLANTVKRICEKAGIKGYKTNHSLRVTAATRLFHSGLDEQLIMERTGHRSTDGVRAYKRSSEEQQEMVSRILNCEKVVDGSSLQNSLPLPAPVPKSQTLTVDASPSRKSPSYCPIPRSDFAPQAVDTKGTSSSMIQIPSQTKETESALPKDTARPLMLTGCSGIVINYNFGK